MHSPETMIATNRFGLGARPGEADEAGADPRAWLLQQLEGQGDSLVRSTQLKSSDVALAEYFQWRSNAERRCRSKFYFV